MIDVHFQIVLLKIVLYFLDTMIFSFVPKDSFGLNEVCNQYSLLFSCPCLAFSKLLKNCLKPFLVVCILGLPDDFLLHPFCQRGLKNCKAFSLLR